MHKILKKYAAIWAKKLIAAFVLALILILLTPVPERDEGPPKFDNGIDKYLFQKPKPNEYLKFLRQSGYTITKNNLPESIEIEKQQVSGHPAKIAMELSKKGYEMLGQKVRVTLKTLGGRYTEEYSP